MSDSYDLESLRKEIIEYLEMEGALMPGAYIELSEIENSDDESYLVKKALKLHLNISKYRI